MRRPIRNGLVVVSLAWMACISSIWIISYICYFRLFLPARATSRDWGMTCYRGSITLAMIDATPRTHSFVWISRRESQAFAFAWDNNLQRFGIMGFAFGKTTHMYSGSPKVANTMHQLRFPIWFPFGMTIFPLLAARKLTSTIQREAAGRCTHCGYDLRATSDRCPECGTEVRSPSPLIR